MSMLRSLLRIFQRSRPAAVRSRRPRTACGDGRTNDMVDGKDLSPTGAVMDFESDSKREP
jgi:hypothetical protein